MTFTFQNEMILFSTKDRKQSLTGLRQIVLFSVWLYDTVKNEFHAHMAAWRLWRMCMCCLVYLRLPRTLILNWIICVS